MRMQANDTGDVVQHNPHRTEAYANRFFVSKKYRLGYASIDKAACTSLKGWMAKIDGAYDAIKDQMRQYDNPDKPKLSIHSAIPLFYPELLLTSYKDISRIFTSDEYRTFAVVRNPYTRIFSAWADKVLKGHHDHTRRLFCKNSFFLNVPLDVDEVRQSFEAFVLYLRDEPEFIQADRHWIPQYFLLRPDLLRFDCIAHLENLGALYDFVSPIVGEELVTQLKTDKRRNISRLSYHPAFITDTAKATIDKLYAKDFAAFGYEHQLPPGKYEMQSAAVEAILLDNMKKRMVMVFTKLDRVDGKYQELTHNPVKSLCNVGSAFAFALRAAVSRLWKRVSGA